MVLGAYHVLIHRLKLDHFRRVTAVGYSCVVFGWMTILSVKQPSSKLSLFGFLSLPISFAPFESLIFTSIIVPQAEFPWAFVWNYCWLCYWMGFDSWDEQILGLYNVGMDCCCICCEFEAFWCL